MKAGVAKQPWIGMNGGVGKKISVQFFSSPELAADVNMKENLRTNRLQKLRGAWIVDASRQVAIYVRSLVWPNLTAGSPHSPPLLSNLVWKHHIDLWKRIKIKICIAAPVKHRNQNACFPLLRLIFITTQILSYFYTLNFSAAFSKLI